jgi:predicted nucleic acid-binding protein
MFVADTRFLVSLTIPPDNNLRRKIRNLLRKALRDGLLIPAIVLTEFIAVLAPRLGMQGCLTQIAFLETEGAEVVEMTKRIAILAGQLRMKHKIPIADAIIIATHLQTKARAVLTDDPHIAKIVKTKWIGIAS